MEELIKFFIEVGKLKEIKRRGWLIRGIKSPETVADHSFRVLILAFIFGLGTKMNIKRLLRIALFHSSSAVYIDYISPYDKVFEAKTKKEALKKYPALLFRAPYAKKEKILKQRYEEEEKAIKELTQKLEDPIKSEIIYLWQDFQHRTSREAKFIYILDKLENLIQALEYKDQLDKELIKPFLLQIREITNDKNILSLVDSLDAHFTKGEDKIKSRKDKNLIRFILQVGKLKVTPRRGWVLRGVKNPESIASHCFRMALMGCVFSGRKRLDRTVVLEMALFHDLFASVIGDVTPYDRIASLVKDKSKLFETLPWMGVSESKKVIVLKNLEKEVGALDKVISGLPHNLKHEIKYLWLEYKTGGSKEARFARQVDRIEGVIQAMEYYQRNKTTPVKAFWLELKELIDDPLLSNFVEHLDFYFLQGNKRK